MTGEDSSEVVERRERETDLVGSKRREEKVSQRASFGLPFLFFVSIELNELRLLELVELNSQGQNSTTNSLDHDFPFHLRLFPPTTQPSSKESRPPFHWGEKDRNGLNTSTRACRNCRSRRRVGRRLNPRHSSFEASREIGEEKEGERRGER